MDNAEHHFSGYATKAGLKCSDGRTITPDAFKHMDGQTVPLVWQHGKDKPENVLGHAVLEARDDGVYAYGFFNETAAAQNAKQLVEHKDITALSIYANQLVEKSKSVLHGIIREVSLVLSGANPGALIDFIAINHGDGDIEVMDDEAVIYTGLEISLQHSDEKSEEGESTDEEIEHGKTVQDVYDSLSDEQREVVNYMIGAAIAGAKAKHSDDKSGEGNLEHQEGTEEMTNVFEKSKATGTGPSHELTHDAIRGIVANADKMGSLKAAVEDYALQHGIENIDILFPDAKTVTDRPEWISRRMEWVSGVINGTRHTPFSRIKTRAADITHEEARARGYVKGNLKKEEYFGLSQRITTPTTVYKKQKLDRDDIIDITDFDVVVWMKAEMRVMLDEELARAVLIGDGRDVADEDKIRDPAGASEGAGIRSILNDHELYVTRINVNIDDANSDYNEVVEAVMRARRFYKGSGAPTFYTTNQTLVEMLLSKDSFGRRRWNTTTELAAALMVNNIVEVEVMDTVEDLLGIIVNLNDYALGADRGGEVSLFDDFDIDYNQYKYLIETRLSGALIKIKSAMTVFRTAGAGDVLRVPTAPAFDGTDITIPTDANVAYEVDGTPTADGTVVPVAAGETVVVTAVPAAGSYFATNAEDEWSFTNEV